MDVSPESTGKGTARVLAAGAVSLTTTKNPVAAAEPLSREVPPELALLLDKIPSAADAEAAEVFEAMLRGGADTIRCLVALVGPEFGDPGGVKPKYALHGMVHYASRPDAPTQRKLVAETLAQELAPGHSDELKAFLCRQLQLCGRTEEVPALAPLLTSDRLCEPATQALSAMGGEQAVAALRRALPAAAGKRRATIINALGRLKDESSAAEIRKSAEADDRDERLVAWYALANAADDGSADILLSAAERGDPYERTQATDACLRLARRLGETGNTAAGEKICRALMARRTSADETHDRCAALDTLAIVLGTKAVGDVMAALDAKHAAYRHPAARTAVKLASSIRQDEPQQAEKLLAKVLAATAEQAVRQQAELLLGKYDA